MKCTCMNKQINQIKTINLFTNGTPVSLSPDSLSLSLSRSPWTFHSLFSLHPLSLIFLTITKKILSLGFHIFCFPKKVFIKLNLVTYDICIQHLVFLIFFYWWITHNVVWTRIFLCIVWLRDDNRDKSLWKLAFMTTRSKFKLVKKMEIDDIDISVTILCNILI